MDCNSCFHKNVCKYMPKDKCDNYAQAIHLPGQTHEEVAKKMDSYIKCNPLMSQPYHIVIVQ